MVNFVYYLNLNHLSGKTRWFPMKEREGGWVDYISTSTIVWRIDLSNSIKWFVNQSESHNNPTQPEVLSINGLFKGNE